jgi:hypothetical protein
MGSENRKHLRAIRIWLSLFIAGLVLSGVTAFSLAHEVAWLDRAVRVPELRSVVEPTYLLSFIGRVDQGLQETDARYPFLPYGTDWLAFAHLAIAVAFIGPWTDPVRNKWVVTFGLIACAGVIPLALIAGGVRCIPLAWRLIDCCFGVFGSIPLFVCRRHIHILEQLKVS